MLTSDADRSKASCRAAMVRTTYLAGRCTRAQQEAEHQLLALVAGAAPSSMAEFVAQLGDGTLRKGLPAAKTAEFDQLLGVRTSSMKLMSKCVDDLEQIMLVANFS